LPEERGFTGTIPPVFEEGVVKISPPLLNKTDVPSLALDVQMSTEAALMERGGGQTEPIMKAQEDIEQGFADAGWQLDGSFSEHLVIGHHGTLSILAHLRSWDYNVPTYELYDVQRHLSYRVREIPTPQRAGMLIQEYGEPPDEEHGEPS
jgi:hypothetical protein